MNTFHTVDGSAKVYQTHQRVMQSKERGFNSSQNQILFEIMSFFIVFGTTEIKCSILRLVTIFLILHILIYPVNIPDQIVTESTHVKNLNILIR